MSPENAKVIADFMTAALANEYQTTRRILAALPEEHMKYHPHEKGFVAGALAWHIATSEVFFLTGISNGEFLPPAKIEAPATVAEIVAYYDANVPPLLEKIKNLTGEQAAKVLDFRSIFTFPAVVFMNLANSHSIHHRGQLSAYIRTVGAKVPVIYGKSADEG